MPKYYLIAIEVPDNASTAKMQRDIKELGETTGGFEVTNGYRIHEDVDADFRNGPDMFLKQALAQLAFMDLTAQLEAFGEDADAISRVGGYLTMYRLAQKQVTADVGLHEVLKDVIADIVGNYKDIIRLNQRGEEQ